MGFGAIIGCQGCESAIFSQRIGASCYIGPLDTIVAIGILEHVVLEVNTAINHADHNASALKGLGKTSLHSRAAITEHVVGIGIIAGLVGEFLHLAGHVNFLNLGNLGNTLDLVDRNHGGHLIIKALLDYYAQSLEFGGIDGIDVDESRHHIPAIHTLSTGNIAFYRLSAQQRSPAHQLGTGHLNIKGNFTITLGNKELSR